MDQATDRTHAFFAIDPARENVFGIRILGKFSVAAMAELVQRLEPISERGDKARIYVDLVKFRGAELAMVKEKLSNLRTLWHTIEKMAYIVDQSWLATGIALVDAVTPMHIRAFDHEHQHDAREWLLRDDE